MNWIDRAVGYLSPQAGIRRARARLALQMVRAYDAAKMGRRTAGWNARGNSANAEVMPALSTVRNRCRDLVRNNPHAAKAINSLVANAIGTGIIAKTSLGDVWKRWADEECDADGQLDLNGLQSLIGRSVLESGECLVRYRVRPASWGLSIPLQLQVLEPDYLDHLRFGATPNGGIIVGGVEFDAIGQRVAYWLWPQHPGELNYIPKNFQSRPVPASEILHIYEKMRPGQVRGMPRLAVSALKLRDLDDYEDAHLVRKKIEACFAAFVIQGEENPLGAVSTDTSGAPNNVRRIEELEPGLIKYLGSGEDVKFAEPTSTSGYGEYTATQLHAIAAGAGTTYELMTGNYDHMNFSSARMAKAEFKRLVEMFQWLTFIPMFLKPLHRRVADTAYLAGSTRKRVHVSDWTTPRWESTDPLKDAQATKEDLRGGMISPPEAIRQRGFDPDQVRQETKEWNDAVKQDGLVFDSNAAVAISGRPANPADSAVAEGADPAKEPASATS